MIQSLRGITKSNKMIANNTPVQVIWLNANGCYAVTFSEQLLSINGQTLFQYKWQLEEALHAVDLVCLDFEGTGTITVMEQAHTGKRYNEEKGWRCPECDILLTVRGPCHACGHA